MPMISRPTVYGTHGGNHSLHATPAARGRAMRSARSRAELRRIAPRMRRELRGAPIAIAMKRKKTLNWR